MLLINTQVRKTGFFISITFQVDAGVVVRRAISHQITSASSRERVLPVLYCLLLILSLVVDNFRMVKRKGLLSVYAWELYGLNE